MRKLAFSEKRPQRGGTILGFIIGGVVGLLAALIVAVFVTKVPVPFVNKAVNRNAEKDQAETVKNKNWNPNAPLDSAKSAAPKAAEASGVVVSGAAPSSAAAAAAYKPLEPAKKGAEAAPKPAPDALGDLVKAKMGQAPAVSSASAPVVLAPKPPAPAAPAAVDAANAFFVQAGAYANPDDAEAQRGKIALSGLEAKVTEREVSGRTVYRVRVGPIEKKPDADKVRERLEGLGYDARVMTVSR